MLNSDKVTLRAVEPYDADFMYEIENDVTSWRYGETIAPISRKIIREYALTYDGNPFSAGQLRLIITETGNGNPVGIIDLYEICKVNGRAFAGIYIMPEFRGKGLAGKALSLIEEYARKVLHLRLLAARVENSNTASVNLFRSKGYECEATIRDWFVTDSGNCSDLFIFTKRLD